MGRYRGEASRLVERSLGNAFRRVRNPIPMALLLDTLVATGAPAARGGVVNVARATAGRVPARRPLGVAHDSVGVG
jgi:hypothetical protein